MASKLSSRGLVACALPALLLGIVTPAGADPIAATLDAATRHQTIEGLGSSIFIFTNEEKNPREELARTFTQDLGASILRIDMFHTSLNGHYNDIDTEGDTRGQSVPDAYRYRDDHDFYKTPVHLDGTSADVAKFDMNAERVRVYGDWAEAMNRQKLDDFKVVGSVWSPPIWMKGQERDVFTDAPVTTWDGSAKLPFIKNTDVIGGSLIDTAENRQQLGRFIAGYTQAFEQEFGVSIGNVSLQNEVELSTFYGSTVYSPQVYADTLVDVRAALDEAGLQDTGLFGPEGVGSSEIGTYFRSMVYADVIRDTPGALDALAAWAVHGYDASGRGAGGDDAASWDRLLNALPVDGPDHGWKGYLYAAPNNKYFGGEAAGVVSEDEWVEARRGLASDGIPIWMTETSGQADKWRSSVSADTVAGFADVVGVVEVRIQEAYVTQYQAQQSGASAERLAEIQADIDRLQGQRNDAITAGDTARESFEEGGNGAMGLASSIHHALVDGNVSSYLY